MLSERRVEEAAPEEFIVQLVPPNVEPGVPVKVIPVPAVTVEVATYTYAPVEVETRP